MLKKKERKKEIKIRKKILIVEESGNYVEERKKERKKERQKEI